MLAFHFNLNYSPIMSKSPTCPKSAGRPKAADVEARNAELVQTAGQLFLKKGYTGVSLETIAREARVAVRTIYVKFGGKAGLLMAVLGSRRERFFVDRCLADDMRPLREVIDDFARDFYDLLVEPDAIAMQRVVIAEAGSDRELAQAFYDGGPRLARATLERYFARPDIRAQLRDGVPLEIVPIHLIACINGDPIGRFLFPESEPGREESRRQLTARLELFYHGVLKEP